MALETPVVFLIFKRPEPTARVFERIASRRPKTLLIVADGPRPDRAGEAERVEATRRVVERIDWPCRVLKNYSSVNLGCKARVSSGLTWAFEQVDEAIIFEDDCLPADSFFGYCESLLERYRQDERVMAVAGCNFQNGQSRTDASYYFSKYPHCWGWATWRRAWRHFEVGMSQWPTFRDGGGLRQVADSPLEEHYWNDTFEREFRGQIDSWAFAWTFNVWSRGGLTALPDVNLISNIGFDAESTHTRDAHHALSCLPTLELPQPLRHPSEVVRNVEADRHTFEHAFGAETSAADLPWGKRLERSVRKVRDRVLAAWRKPGGRSNKPAFLG